jgi:mono/diheme cytochrome c family protein
MKFGSPYIVSTAVLGGLFIAVAAAAPQSQWDGLYTVEQAKRGGALFEEKCSTCHGSDLMGSQMAPPLVGKDFSTGWNDLPLADMFELIKETMPQDNPGTLTNAQAADILAFLLERGSYPPGKSELSGETEELKKYKFVAARP